MSAALEWPLNRRITVNLAPAALRKEGSGFDLPISLAVLAATRQLPPERLAQHAAVGELGLDGRIRPVAGTLAVAEGARLAGLERVVCAAESAPEAALAGVEPDSGPASRRGGRIPARRDRRAAVRPALERRARVAERARPRRRARPGAGAARARDRGGRLAQPPAPGAAGHGEDDARAPAARDPAAASAPGVARGHAHPLGVRAAAAVATADHRPAVPRAAPRRVGAGRRGRRSGPAPGEVSLAHRGVLAARRAARSSRARCSRRSGSRSRTASSPSRESAATRSSRRASSSSGR